MKQAVRFYGDTLGLERSAYIPERGYAEFETGNLTLSIIVPEKMGMEHFTSRAPIALHVDDMAQARARLTDAGVEFQGEPFDTGVCFMSFFSRPERQRADAPSPLRAAHAAALSGRSRSRSARR